MAIYLINCASSIYDRIIEWLALGGTLKDLLVPTLRAMGKGHLPLDQGAQSSMQPGPEYFQGWDIQNLSEQHIQY